MFLAPSADNETRNHETDCSSHHPSHSTLRSKGLTLSKMIYIFLEISPRILEKKGIIFTFCIHDAACNLEVVLAVENETV